MNTAPRSGSAVAPVPPWVQIEVPSPEQEARAVERWNERHPVGTAVRYYPSAGQAHFRRTFTESAAWLSRARTAVILTGAAQEHVPLHHILPESEVEA